MATKAQVRRGFGFDPGSSNEPVSGPSVPSGGGSGGGNILDTLIESGGNLLANALSSAIGNVGGNLLTSLLIAAGVPENVIQVLTQGGAFGSTEAGGGPSYPGGFGILPPLPDVRGLDPGGLGGGVLNAVTNSGLSGAVAGSLLRSKRIKLPGLLVTPGLNPALASLYRQAIGG